MPSESERRANARPDLRDGTRPKQTYMVAMQPVEGLSTYSRVFLEAVTVMLWPLKHDERVTLLFNLLAQELGSAAIDEDQIETIVEVMRTVLQSGLDERTR